jgi:CPA2 family monovalent cation:H+ antiporter-2
VAWVTSSVGLSLSLGAFLAGLVISESEYSDEAVGHVLPFQAIFTSFFFVSMGMLLDLGFFLQQPLMILALTAAILLIKFLLAGFSAQVVGMPLRSAILAGIGLAQVGEFSFVIAQAGISLGLASEYCYQLFLSVSLLTMALTPTLISFAHSYAGWISRLPLPHKIKTGLLYIAPQPEERKLEGHLIIVGFGMRGRQLARMAKEKQLPYLILEMNPETVKNEKKKGEPIRYGDASHASVLKHAGIKNASMLVVVINDPLAGMKIIKIAKELNPSIHLISRARYFQEARAIFHAGADEVITDELGSSLEILTRVMQKYGAHEVQIRKTVEEMRSESDQEAIKWGAKTPVAQPVEA